MKKTAAALLTVSLAAAQSPEVVRIGHFPPGTPTTWSFPTGTLPAMEYSMCTGHVDPASGREFAVAGASNGILFVDAIPPYHAWDNLSGVQLDSWFFADAPASRWRGLASFRDHIYATSFMHAGIRTFRIDTSGQRSQWIVDLGYDAASQTQIRSLGPRSCVDQEHGLLYLVGIDPASNAAMLAVYDLFDESAGTVLEPPTLLAAWTPGGLIFDVFPKGNLAYVSYQSSASPGSWRILDVSQLWTNPPATPFSWNPPFTEWTSTAVANPLSHDSYVSPGGRYWFTVDEGNQTEGHMIARDMGASPPVLNNGTMPEPPVVGAYNLVPTGTVAEPMHSLRGIGHTGYVSHWSAGLHVIDLSAPPGGTNEYPLVTLYDTSTMPPSASIGDGLWDCHPYQDSGVVYANDSEEGLSLLRLDVGQLNRYGPATPNGAGTPRIEGNARPPRVGSAYEVEVTGLQPGNLGALLLALREDPLYMAHSPQTLLGATVLVDLPSSMAFLRVADAAGGFAIPFPIPNDPAFAGWKLFLQAFEVTSSNSLAASRGTWFGIAH
ncbi:MAG: hypothetical protein Fur0037_11890 [Planctomycetota bacterium]